MPNDNTTPDSFKEFMQMYQQAQQPNLLEGLGAGMAGFAAPFLGQQWTNPYARPKSDPYQMLMLKAMMEKGATKEVFGVTPEGGLESMGQVPKGSQVVTPPATQIATKAEMKAGDIKKETISIDNMVNTLYKTADELIPAVEDPKKAELLGVKRSLGSASVLGMRPQRLFGGSDENVIAYNETMKAEATPIIRSMGEKGMLTNQDIERALGLFPKNSDSIKLRTTRREELRKFLKSKIEAYYKDTKESPSGQGVYNEGDTVTKNGITYTFNGKEWEY